MLCHFGGENQLFFAFCFLHSAYCRSAKAPEMYPAVTNLEMFPFSVLSPACLHAEAQPGGLLRPPPSVGRIRIYARCSRLPLRKQPSPFNHSTVLILALWHGTGTSLTLGQFVSQFGPTPAQVQAVESYLSSNGFTNITVEDNRLIVEAEHTSAFR
jgi:Pro-kumamolisin, activation domain